VHLLVCELHRFHTKFVQKMKTHILCSTKFLLENGAVYGVTGKTIVDARRPYGNMAHAHCMLVTQGHKHA